MRVQRGANVFDAAAGEIEVLRDQGCGPDIDDRSVAFGGFERYCGVVGEDRRLPLADLDGDVAWAVSPKPSARQPRRQPSASSSGVNTASISGVTGTAPERTRMRQAPQSEAPPHGNSTPFWKSEFLSESRMFDPDDGVVVGDYDA